MAATGTETDSAHLRRALELAEGGRGRVSPNPIVGAVLVDPGGGVIGEGFHAELGGLHAERAALEDCRARGADPEGATLYVTLEPCAHRGRQPPCSEAILEAGIARVLYASEDPTEKASGAGAGMLRDGGVEVRAGLRRRDRRRPAPQPGLPQARPHRPAAGHLQGGDDPGRARGRSGGDSRWISGAPSRELVHRWRAESDAIAVNRNRLGRRSAAHRPHRRRRGVRRGSSIAEPAVRNPARVVFDSQARLPLDSALIASIDEAPLLVICAPEAPTAARSALERRAPRCSPSRAVEPAATGQLRARRARPPPGPGPVRRGGTDAGGHALRRRRD